MKTPSCSQAGFKNNFLELVINEAWSLTEITAKVQEICNQAEEQSQNLIVLRFLPMAPGSYKWLTQVNVQDINRWERAVRRLERLAAVIIAVGLGDLAGPAVDLLLVADFRLVSLNFNLYFSIYKGQVWPGMAMFRLVQQVGAGRSRQLLMETQPINAQKALDFNIIDEVCPDILQSLEKAKIRFSGFNGADFSLRRQLLLEATTMSYEEAIGSYLAACDRELRKLPVFNEQA